MTEEYHGIDIFNTIFREPQVVFNAIQKLRMAAQRQRLPFPDEMVINPDLIGLTMLFGCPVRFDSTLAPGEIRLVNKDPLYTVSLRVIGSWQEVIDATE